jgi:hypothetical protein
MRACATLADVGADGGVNVPHRLYLKDMAGASNHLCKLFPSSEGQSGPKSHVPGIEKSHGQIADNFELVFAKGAPPPTWMK